LARGAPRGLPIRILHVMNPAFHQRLRDRREVGQLYRSVDAAAHPACRRSRLGERNGFREIRLQQSVHALGQPSGVPQMNISMQTL
jgi:hypothetical protein